MLVKNWMNKDFVTIKSDNSMQEAIRLLKEYHVELLPVVDNKKLVGVITDRDLKEASASDATSLDAHEVLYLISKIKVKEIMSKNPITVHSEFTIEETAQLLIDKNISGAPVVDDDGKVIGIISKTELFKVIISLTGVEAKRGIQFAFRVDDRPGSIKEVADIIRKHGGRMESILSTHKDVPEGFRKVFIRMYDIDRDKIKQLTDELRKASTLLYIVDHVENRREIFPF
ncbi:CBS and ACT domain-containing protein [bacterium]|nr:CBS and ACT domain-containing protein [bacterium]